MAKLQEKLTGKWGVALIAGITVIAIILIVWLGTMKTANEKPPGIERDRIIEVGAWQVGKYIYG